MPRPGWSPKRERQYEHIRDGLLGRGMTQDKAAEIAARTVNKERARSGEAKVARPLSTDRPSGSRAS
jgi:hypothetical protein